MGALTRRIVSAALAAAAFLFLFGFGVTAQQSSIKDRLLGAWTLVSVLAEAADGQRTEPFGPNPIGTIIFAPEGHFSLFQSRTGLPNIAANDRAKATAEEAQAIMAGAIAYFGTYAIEADNTISVKLDGSTFPNLIGGAAQKRIVTSLTGEEFKFTNPRTPSGITLHTVWKRAKS
jgi:hypothetical protein